MNDLAEHKAPVTAQHNCDLGDTGTKSAVCMALAVEEPGDTSSNWEIDHSEPVAGLSGPAPCM